MRLINSVGNSLIGRIPTDQISMRSKISVGSLYKLPAIGPTLITISLVPDLNFLQGANVVADSIGTAILSLK